MNITIEKSEASRLCRRGVLGKSPIDSSKRAHRTESIHLDILDNAILVHMHVQSVYFGSAVPLSNKKGLLLRPYLSGL
jgi:hypothetical protein